ncbi:MAG: hypothetical protein RLN90_02770 [Balneolaceae bacterium]
MRYIILLVLFFGISCTSELKNSESTEIPIFLIGSFQDDYDVSYFISDSLFEMEDHTKLHILKWDIKEQYFVGQNDSLNPYDPLLYTKIEWMEFEDMAPFEWGFCMSVFNASSLDSAITVRTANRDAPKTGCGGYPFSRMKRSD